MVYPHVFLESFDVLTLLVAITAMLWLSIVLAGIGFLCLFLLFWKKFPYHKRKSEDPVKKLTKKEKKDIGRRQGKQFLLLLVTGFSLSIGIGQLVGWYLQESILIAILSLGLIIVVWMLTKIDLPAWVVPTQVLVAILLAVVITVNQGVLVYPDRVVYKSVTSRNGIASRVFMATPRMQLIIYCQKNPRIGGYRTVEQPRLCGSYLTSPTVTRFGVVGDINIRRIDTINAAIISTFNLECTGSSSIDDNPFIFQVVCRQSPALQHND